MSIGFDLDTRGQREATQHAEANVATQAEIDDFIRQKENSDLINIAVNGIVIALLIVLFFVLKRGIKFFSTSVQSKPVNRVFYLVLVFGILIQTVNLAVFCTEYRSTIYSAPAALAFFIEILDLDALISYWGAEKYGGYRIVGAIAWILIIIGLLFSVFYEKTVGPIARWISKGSPNR